MQCLINFIIAFIVVMDHLILSSNINIFGIRIDLSFVMKQSWLKIILFD